VVSKLHEQMNRGKARLPRNGGMRFKDLHVAAQRISPTSGSRWGSRPVSGRGSWATSGPSSATICPGCSAACFS
jgi:hypothetical protein